MVSFIQRFLELSVMGKYPVWAVALGSIVVVAGVLAVANRPAERREPPREQTASSDADDKTFFLVPSCDHLSGEEYDLCMHTKATIEGNPRLCDQIKSQNVRDACYIVFIMSGAYTSILPEGYSIDCEMQDPGQKDVCYRILAMAYLDSSLCERIKNKGERENCLHDLAYFIDRR